MQVFEQRSAASFSFLPRITTNPEQASLLIMSITSLARQTPQDNHCCSLLDSPRLGQHHLGTLKDSIQPSSPLPLQSIQLACKTRGYPSLLRPKVKLFDSRQCHRRTHLDEASYLSRRLGWISAQIITRENALSEEERDANNVHTKWTLGHRWEA
jgi:hypothetical protein